MMKKIVFMGTPSFSVPILEGLIQQGYDIMAVVTQPDRPVGRKRIITPTPVKERAIDHGIEVLQPEKLSGSVEMERIIELSPDLIVTAAFGQFLPERLLKLPKYGCINVHASLLPKYRGGAPVHYALINGEKETGITIMNMVKQMDAGDILKQKSIDIGETDDVGILFEKLSLLGRETLLDMLPDYFSGKLTAIPQNESEVTYSPNITREEEVISWEKTAQEIDWQVRGMRPWPGAFTTFQDQRWKIWDVSVLEEKTREKPGTIINVTKKELKLAAGNATVLTINQIQPSGKGKLSISEFLNGIGKNISIGEHVN